MKVQKDWKDGDSNPSILSYMRNQLGENSKKKLYSLESKNAVRVSLR